MAWLDCCEHLKVNYSGLHRRLNNAAALMHTNGGGSSNGSLRGWWESGAKGQRGPDNLHIGAQFQVKRAGKPEQYVDSDLVVYHAYSASEFAVGIETEDDSKPGMPWNDNQLEGIVAILHELKVPARLLTSAGPSNGLGWHSKYASWNKTGHQCAGDVRDKQIRHEILPALAKAHGQPTHSGGRDPKHQGPTPPKWWHRVLQFQPAQHPGAIKVIQGIHYQVGDDVAHVQRKVGVKADGLYGPNTADHVRVTQRHYGLIVDGIVGPKTARVL